MGKCSQNPYKKKNRTAAAAKTPPSQRPQAASQGQGQAQATCRPGAVPPRHNLDDSARIRLIPDPKPGPGPGAQTSSGPLPPPFAAADTGPNGNTKATRESRANRVKNALRSKILFPLDMLTQIDELASAYALQLGASTPLDRWLTFELARSSVQCDKVTDLLQVNEIRVLDSINTCWNDISAEKADKLACRLPAEPYNVKRALERTKHGALYLLEAWTLLGESVDASGGLDEPQRQVAFDLLGIAPVHRHSSIRVPAGTDTKGLKALVAREAGRLRSRLEQVLNDRCESQKEMAQLGIVKDHDSETKKLRSDQTRARRRFSWALDTLLMLRNGVPASSIIDPDTGKPVAAGPPASAVPEPARPGPSASASAPASPSPSPQPAASTQPPAAAQASTSVRPLPADCTEEQREMYFVAAGAILGEPAVLAGVTPGPSPTA